jgi:hypothetical protein
MDLGITDDGERAGREQAAQITIALFADATELVLASARVAGSAEISVPPRYYTCRERRRWIVLGAMKEKTQ